MNDKLYSVAIDGPSGAGKSTVARELAKRLDFIYVDTGAIYRTVALACVLEDVDCKDEERVIDVLKNVEIDIRYIDGTQAMYLNGSDVSAMIRKPEISAKASDVSANPSVREFLLGLQRSFAEKYSVLMDGRDIGTVVLPDADVKIYLTASAETRAKRRYDELLNKGTQTTYEEVLNSIIYRDTQDLNRQVAPLRKAEDAIEINSGNMDFETTVNVIYELLLRKILG